MGLLALLNLPQPKAKPAQARTDNRGQLAEADKKVFATAAYWAAKQDAKGHSKLQAPDAAQMADKFAQAEIELREADKRFKESLKLQLGGWRRRWQSEPRRRRSPVLRSCRLKPGSTRSPAACRARL